MTRVHLVPHRLPTASELRVYGRPTEDSRDLQATALQHKPGALGWNRTGDTTF